MSSNDRMERLKLAASELPKKSGVYLMKDKQGKVIYVGKAKVLPKRVGSYFQNKNISVRINLMVTQIQSFDFVVTANEKEALILENSLIKKYHPKYNVVLRDDKTYPSLRLNTKEDFPRLEIVRRPVKDGSLIFGPFASSSSLRETIRLILKIFPLRQCRLPDVKKASRPCLNFQMKKCVGPCRPSYTKEEYKKLTDQVRLFFRGNHQELLKNLEQEMSDAAERYDFEKAADLRDKIADVKKTLERQIVAKVDDKDQDVLGLYRDQGFVQGAMLFIRAGAVTGCQPLEISGGDDAFEEDIITSLLGQHYGAGHYIPDEIILPEELEIENKVFFEDWLSGLKNKTVRIYNPKKGDRLRLLEMVYENAKVKLKERLQQINKSQGVLLELGNKLGLEKIPRRLECLDLAHLQGDSAAGGIVVMEEGEWKKSQYKRFKLKNTPKGDDYQGIKEVIKRRFSHEDWPWPDLFMIDGGKGQLSAALAAFDELGIKKPNLASIAEARSRDEIDRIFIPNRKNPVDLKSSSPALLLLSNLRDEAHRYVRSYYHKLQTKKMFSSPLELVSGLGPKKREILINKYGSLEEIYNADDIELGKAVSLSIDKIAILKNKLKEIINGA